MGKEFLRKMLAVITIITLIMSDFFVLGNGLVSYAVEQNKETNNANIEFATYFKNETGEKVESIEVTSNENDLKLYAEVTVKNEGYFNGTIELMEGNFVFNNTIKGNKISKIEGNKVTLNQINAGEKIEIEIGITPINSEMIKETQLMMSSKIKLTGNYMETTYKGKEISAEKTVNLKISAEKDTSLEIYSEVNTNKIYKINGENKRIVQVIAKSRITDNNYPVKSSTVTAIIPEQNKSDLEAVKITQLGTRATNGDETTKTQEWDKTSGEVKITAENIGESIAWKKSSYDEYVITYIYKETTDVRGTELKAIIETELYNNEGKVSNEVQIGLNDEEKSKIAISEIKNTQGEIYKGQMYANARTESEREIPYNTTTKIIVAEKDVIDSLKIKEQKDSYVTSSDEIELDSKYYYTTINKQQMINLLGDEGTIQIKYGDDKVIINKETDENENGDIVVKYDQTVGEIEIITSKPQKEGTLEIKHEKAILKGTNTADQIRATTGIKTTNTIIGLMENQEISNVQCELTKELLETYTKAELTTNKANLSTMTTNNEMSLGVKLLTYGTQYDLYKNPTIEIKLPEEVKNVELVSVEKLYAEEFKVKKSIYNEENNTIEIKLEGEQTAYAGTEASQLYLQININVELEQTTPSKTGKIAMMYTNENAIQYIENGVVEQEIGITAPSGIIAMNNLQTYNITTIAGISQDKQVVNLNKETAGGTNAKFQLAVVNNTGNNISGVKILGNFPTSGEMQKGEETIINTLDTTIVQKIDPGSAKVYYSEKMNATEDLTNTSNGWTQDATKISTAKSYLIDLGTMNIGEKFITDYVSKIPTTVDYDLVSYAGYKVIYDEQGSKQTLESALVGMTTEGGVKKEDIKIETKIEATIGNEKITEGEKIRAGEVIKYKVTVKNIGQRKLKNAKISGIVPEGTVLVTPEKDTMYTGYSYFVENTEQKMVSKDIENFEINQEETIEYEVRVNMNIENGQEISNKGLIQCEEYTVEGQEYKNIVEESNIRVTLKPLGTDEDRPEVGYDEEYLVYIENLSEADIKNVNLEVIMKGQKLKYMNCVSGQDQRSEEEKIKIDTIPANEIVAFRITATVEQENETTIYAKVTEENGNVYRSNLNVQNTYMPRGEISLSSASDGEYVKVGDKIIYNIAIKNTSEMQYPITLIDNIPEELEIQEIKENGETIMQTADDTALSFMEEISNSIEYSFIVDAGSTTNVEIITRVRQPEGEYSTKTIRNTAQIRIDEEIKGTSTEVTHILRKASEEEEIGNIISGIAWLDENRDGQKDAEDSVIPGIIVRLIEKETGKIATNLKGEKAETKTNEEGRYIFDNLEQKEYIVIFEYDTTKYEMTTYMKEGVPESQNSNAIEKQVVTNDGKIIGNAVTDTINLKENVSNINIGLKANLKFDLELGKYISNVIVQNSKGTKTYECKDEETLKKIEIHSKQIEGSVVVLEYTIKVKNTGEIAGYVTSLRDYMPSGLTFSSELNPEWYLSGQDLYTKTLANSKIEPGETKEIKLILTKTMTSSNVGLINNRAEIAECYNELGKLDIDSTVNNQANDEDDIGSADVIIGISTGIKTILYTILMITNIGLIGLAMYLVLGKKTIKLQGVTKDENN